MVWGPRCQQLLHEVSLRRALVEVGKGPSRTQTKFTLGHPSLNNLYFDTIKASLGLEEKKI